MVRSTKISYLLMFAVPVVVAILAYENGTAFLLSKWLDFDHGAYNHGFLLLLVTLYLLYSEVDIARDISRRLNYIGFVAAAFFLILASALEAISVVGLQIIAFYFFVVFLILAVFGEKILKKAIVPIGLMLFAMPIWDGLGPILQRITLEMSYLMVKAAGIPVFKDGFYLMIPAGNFEVAAGCSGFSYFMAAFPLAIFYAATHFKNKMRFFLVVGAIVIASIVANWMRVFIIIVAGHMTDMQHYFVTVEHFNLGWFIFAFMFVALLFLFKKIPDERRARDVANMNECLVAGECAHYSVARSIVAYSIILTVTGLIFTGFQYRMSMNEIEIREENMAASVPVPGIFRHSTALYELDPKTNGASESTYVTYEYEPPIQLYHAMLARQEQGKEAVSSDNALYSKEKWWLVSEVNEKDDVVRKIELESKITGERYLLWSWYRVNGKNTASDIKAKWYEFQGYLKGDNSGSIVSLLTPKTIDAERNLRLTYKLMMDL